MKSNILSVFAVMAFAAFAELDFEIPGMEAESAESSSDQVSSALLLAEQLEAEPLVETETPVVAEPVVPEEISATNARPARVTSDSTIYNRKEGIAVFDGNVHLDDAQYQMHADKVYIFMEGTNDIKRLVAVGNVAMTNEMRMAYGAKASYTKQNGLVVLYGDDKIIAEVRDETKGEPQIVRGRKIRFWIDSEQVEVLDADISGPAAGSGGFGAQDIKNALGK